MEYQLTLNWPDFLERHWQKRPVVLKRGFSNFIDPLSPDELAGLAMESEIDSRLVSHQDGKWQVSHGPFESYDHLGESNWSLLVQAVNHWHEPTAALMRPFRALPDWRIDDLMISFSVPGGGVGPHLDQYDVFIIQGTGRRRWRVGEKLQMRQHCPHPDLLQVDPFEAIIDEELEPGDILYIPPGFPHEGYALENAMNYSVGFRAPNSRELISGFADYVLQRELGNTYYSDPDMPSRKHPADILPLAMPAVAAGWLLSFTLSMDDVVVSSFVTGPGYEILPLKIYSMVKVGVSPEVNALATVLLVLSLVMVIASQLIARDKTKGR